MITVSGTTFDDLTKKLDTFEHLFNREMYKVMSDVASRLGVVTTAAAEPLPPEPPPAEPLVSLDTLTLIASLWATAVAGTLIASVTDAYLSGAMTVGAALLPALAEREQRQETSRDETPEGVTAPPELPTELPDEEDLLAISTATDFLAQAENRMVRFSDVMWDTARAQLLEGMMAGESIDKLRDRLVSVAGLSEPRARTVARTEIISAENAGSLAMVTSLGFTGSKIWEATEDTRTRETHETADQDKVLLTDLFNVGGSMLAFPGDPTGPPDEIINCRCTLRYELDEDDESLTATGAAMELEWIGVLAVEGRPTGDNRMFAPGSLTWADLPIPLLWQRETGDGHDGSVVVGNVTSIARQNDMILGRGTFDDKDPLAMDAYRRMCDGYLSGVSIDADNFTPDDVEYVYGDGPSQDMGGPSIKMVIFHAGRIRGLTLCAIPAFVEARITAMPTDASMIAAAIPEHDTATVDVPWDSGVQEKKLQSPLQVSTAKGMYAWMDDLAIDKGEIPKVSCKFPHHMVSAKGFPGAANLTACSAGIAALHGARGGTDIPEEDRRGVYEHLARHLKDGGREVPEFTAEPLTAAAYVLTIPDVPPAYWFDEPNVEDMHGALTVTDEGRVYGWLAPAGVEHRSFEKRVTVPMGNVDYSLFLGRETIVAGGGRVVTGALTMDCGHAAMGFSDPTAALDHYDNACSIVASIRIGESSKGVWVAGAIMPGVTANQITRMMACQLSGDWRPHRDKRGWREFAGALLVPVPGFAMTRTEASVRMEEGQLVASAIPVEYRQTACECALPPVPKPRPSLTKTAQMLAASLGLDKASRIERMRKEINNKGISKDGGR